MVHFLRRFSNRSSLIRAVALATAGSGIFFYTTSSDYIFHPLFSSKTDVVPDPRIRKGAAIDAGDNPKHSCNCLGRDTIANVAAKVGPAVVKLSVIQGFSDTMVDKCIGAGTIIDEDGTILTCAYLVVDADGLRPSFKEKVIVTVQDGGSVKGTVVNADLDSGIAIVRIKSKTPLPTAKLGSSSKLRPGDWVVAIGSPFSLQNTITTGIISCVDRKSSDLGCGGMQREYLQTDCVINRGNAGGALFNVDGEVVGVNVWKIADADCVNFFIPIDSVSEIIEHFGRNNRANPNM